jgi:predicted membrane protein
MDDRQVRRGPGRIWAGLFLLLVGGVLLLDQMGFPLPDWLFSWHVLLIALGLFIGLGHNFRGGTWLILILVGGAFMYQDFYPAINLHRFIWPGILIVVGLLFILRPGSHHWREEWHQKWGQNWKEEWEKKHGREWPGRHWKDKSWGGPGNTFARSNESYSSEDFVDATSVFGGVHKKIVSKNFKGGDITTFLGGTEIDLTQADFTGTARLDVTQIMGGTKILVPPHWEVRSQVTAIFAGFEDKRQQSPVTNPEKILIIEGTSIFGGIELKNF